MGAAATPEEFEAVAEVRLQTRGGLVMVAVWQGHRSACQATTVLPEDAQPQAHSPSFTCPADLADASQVVHATPHEGVAWAPRGLE